MKKYLMILVAIIGFGLNVSAAHVCARPELVTTSKGNKVKITNKCPSGRGGYAYIEVVVKYGDNWANSSRRLRIYPGKQVEVFIGTCTRYCLVVYNPDDEVISDMYCYDKGRCQ